MTCSPEHGEIVHCTKKAGLKFAICYEDQSIPQMISRNCVAASNAIPQAQLAMLYLQSNYFSNPTYFQWSNNRSS